MCSVHEASKQHNVRQPLQRTCLRSNRCAADSATVPEENRTRESRRVTTVAREVTGVKTLHTETNLSESHQAHGDSNGARSAKREEENRR